MAASVSGRRVASRRSMLLRLPGGDRVARTMPRSLGRRPRAVFGALGVLVDEARRSASPAHLRSRGAVRGGPDVPRRRQRAIVTGLQWAACGRVPQFHEHDGK
jgi:hypothetical protein